MNPKGPLILLVLLAHVSVGISQFKNTKLDEIGEDSGYGLTIAVNPRHPGNIVASAVPDNIYITKDGGATWKKTTVSSSPGAAIVTDEKGNFYYFHLSDAPGGGEETGRLDRIVIQRSDDGGETWSPGESVGLNPPKHQRNQWATTDSRSSLYLTWTQYDNYGSPDPACQSNILFSMSKNGKKWTDPVVISQTVGNCAENDNTTSGSVPAVTFDGKVFVAWSSQGKVYLDRSFNGGEWWLSNDIVVAEQKGGSRLAIPGHGDCNAMPVLMTDNSKSPYRGSLYIVWADQRNGEDDTDIWFTRSHNFGDNWSLPARVNTDGQGKHQYMPWITVDQSTGYIYIIYYDRSAYDDNRTDVYVAWSTDGGASFRNAVVSEEPFVPQEGPSFRYNNISAQKGTITPIWSRVDDGKVSVWTAVIKLEDIEKKR